MFKIAVAYSVGSLLLLGCAETAQAPDVESTSFAEVAGATDAAEATVPSGGPESVAVQRPTRVNPCETGSASADVWGYFQEAEENGGYAEYCFVFHPDGTLTYSDDGDTAKGTWTRSTDGNIAWKINHGYTWGGIPMPLNGSIEDVARDDGRIVSHGRLSWTHQNRYGRNNIVKTYYGLPSEKWFPTDV